MASLVKDLVDAGIHYGHRSTHWNPKMAPYIFGKRNRIHIIDVKETVKGLLLARKFITKTVSSGKDVLFVGTKRQARGIIEENVKAIEQHYVTERWLGGTLTNYRTIRERLKRLEELEHIEESGEINNYSKKMESQLRREKTKILRNLEGIRNMNKLPGVMVVVDVKFEMNALKEARKLGIPTVCLTDTDADPDFADIAIPGNDDAMRAIEVVVKNLCAAAAEGMNKRAEQQRATEGTGEGGADATGENRPRKRSKRAMFSADGSGTADAETGSDPTAEATGDAPSETPAAEPVAETVPPTNEAETPKSE